MMFRQAAAAAFLMMGTLATLECRQPGNTGVYASIHSGATFLSIDNNFAELSFQPGFYIGGAAGYKIAPTCLRPEVEITYRQSNVKQVEIEDFKFKLNGHIGNVAYMGNLYLDINMDSWLNLSIGGGVGYSQNRGSATYDFGDQDSLGLREHFKAQGFAYQVIVSLDYMFCKIIDIGVSYRYYHGYQHGNEHDIGLSIRRYF